MFIIIIVYDKVLTPTSPVSSQDFYCSLPRDKSWDVTPCLGVSVVLRCASFRVHAFSLPLLDNFFFYFPSLLYNFSTS